MIMNTRDRANTEAEILHAMLKGDKDHTEQLIRRHLNSKERDQFAAALHDSAILLYIIQKTLGET